MKYSRLVLAAVAALAVLGVAGWYFVGWSLNRAFQSATQEGGGLRKVVDVAEATVGSTLARGDGGWPSFDFCRIQQEAAAPAFAVFESWAPRTPKSRDFPHD